MSVHEDTVNSLFREYLSSKDFNIYTHIGVNFHHAPPGEADFHIISSNLNFYGEGEWNSSWDDGFAQAVDYSRAIGAAGGFLIVYPDNLKTFIEDNRHLGLSPELILSQFNYKYAFLSEGRRTVILRNKKLEEIPELLESNINQTREPESDPDAVVEMLRKNVTTLTKGITTVSNLDLFRNIFAGTLPNEDVIKSSSAYYLINQIICYRIISSKNPDKYEEIDYDNLTKVEDLNTNYFLKIFQEDYDYKPIFGHNLTTQFSDLNLIKKTIKIIYGLTIDRIEKDFLGKIFHQLIPLDLRKIVASYYTKDEAAKILAGLSVKKHSDKVADLACGSGTLLKEAYIRKREILEQIQEFKEEDHKHFLENDILGIDVMNFAGHLAIIQLMIQSPEFKTDFVQIAIRDSTTLKVGDKVKPLSNSFPSHMKQRTIDAFLGEEIYEERAKIQEGALGVDEREAKEFQISKQDLIIMNPPFTKKQSMVTFSATYRSELLERFRNYSDILTDSSKYCYFFLILAHELTVKKGRLAFVLPITILRGYEARNLRNWFLENHHIKYIILRRDKSNFSEDTDFRECLFITVKNKENKDKKTTLIFLKSLDSASVEKIKAVHKQCPNYHPINTNLILGYNIPQEELDPNNFFQEVTFSNFELLIYWRETRKAESLTNLINLGISIHSKNEPEKGGKFKGLTLNEKNRQYLRSDPWKIKEIIDDGLIIIHKKTKNQYLIPKKCTKPTLRFISHVYIMDVSNFEEYVLSSEFPEFKDFSNEGDVSLVRWKKWRNYLKSRTSNLFLVERINMTAPGSCVLCFYSKTPRAWSRVSASISNLNNEDAKILCLWFNSSFGLLEYLFQRDEDEGGWMQLQKYIIENLKVPQISELSEDDKKELINVFDEVSSEEFPPILKQFTQICPSSLITEELKELLTNQTRFSDLKDELGKGFEPRKKIDEAVLKYIFKQSAPNDDFLNDLYFKLLIELLWLQILMQ